jgi:membrane-associated phospholipid phosphatase
MDDLPLSATAHPTSPRYKLALLLVTSVAMGVLYRVSSLVPLREPVIVPSTAIDLAIPFLPWTTSIYLSLFALIVVVPWTLRERGALNAYAGGILLMGAVAATVFVIWPTHVELPALPADPLYRAMRSADVINNACPSLHAAMIVFAVLTAIVQLSKRATICVGLWSILVMLSTLTTGQHVVIDLLAGTLLGGVTFLVVGRRIVTADGSTP